MEPFQIAWPQAYFEMIYRFVRRQNEALLRDVAVRENLDMRELRALLPSYAQLRAFYPS